MHSVRVLRTYLTENASKASDWWNSRGLEGKLKQSFPPCKHVCRKINW